MAELEALFSKAGKKKDQKKKGGVKTSENGSTVVAAETEKPSGETKKAWGGAGETAGEAATEKASTVTSGDGWIEFEETKTAQVHTGGKTIVALKREEGVDRDGLPGEGDSGAERFAGWKLNKDLEGGETDGPKDAVKDFPSLADAAKVKTQPAPLPQNTKKTVQPVRRPNQFAALKKLMADTTADNKAVGGARPSAEPVSAAPAPATDGADAVRKPLNLKGLKKLLETDEGDKKPEQPVPTGSDE